MYLPEHVDPAIPEGTPEIQHLFAYNRAMTDHLAAFTQEAMRGPGPLSFGERELLAAMVSQENACLF